jgi:hypothetical protein
MFSVWLPTENAGYKRESAGLLAGTKYKIEMADS